MTPRTPSATALISAEQRRQTEVVSWYFTAQGLLKDAYWLDIPLKDRIRELVKAGALIVAEIERLQRLEK